MEEIFPKGGRYDENKGQGCLKASDLYYGGTDENGMSVSLQKAFCCCFVFVVTVLLH